MSCKDTQIIEMWDCDCLGFLQLLFPRQLVKSFLDWKSNGCDFRSDEWDIEDSGSSTRYLLHGSSGNFSTFYQNLRVHVGSWNVAGKYPPSNLDLSDWLCMEEPADIYVLGFQEIVPLNAANVLGIEDKAPAEMWDSLIRQTLNQSLRKQTEYYHTVNGGEEKLPLISKKREDSEYMRMLEDAEYIRIASKQMVGLFITVWIRRPLRCMVNNVKVSCVGCGLMGYLGNKGSIAVSLSIYDTSFCFICSHLTSGDREADERRRNADVAEILRRTSFPRVSDSLPETILEHQRIIWLGDLNYRLSSPNHETIKRLEMKDYDYLMTKDQLRAEQVAGRVFDGWKEGRIKFAPTYKYIPNTNDYSSPRNPAWCDRILWLGKGLNQISYTRSEYNISDHRPISAIFLAEVEVPCG